MDKVITINNWWDGPLLGLAYYNDTVCIYERIFDEEKDDYGDEYYLTPVSEAEQSKIMNDWKDWCTAVDTKDLNNYFSTHPHPSHIENIVQNSPLKRKYRKRAIFRGELGDGCIPVDASVEWND